MINLHHIDLHMHSTVSDGTETPLELLELVRQHKLELFALTDHDSIKGSEMLLSEYEKEAAGGGEPQPLFLPGIELSCKDGGGKYHILGYAYDPHHESIRSIMDKGHDLRMRKLQGRLDFLRDTYGFSFSDEDIAALKTLDNPGKPHIGNLMVRYGYAPTRTDAIREYIDKAKLKFGHITPEEGITAILESGGVPVLAHPSYGAGDDIIVGEEMEMRIRHLLDMGIQGLEAYYSGFTPKLENELLGYADRYGLYVTAGSDYHGSNKLIKLGQTNLQDAEEPAEGLFRFLDRVLGGA